MAAVIDAQLHEGEVVVRVDRPHWVAIVRPSRPWSLVVVAAIVGLMAGSWISVGGEGLVERLVAMFDTMLGLATLGAFLVAAGGIVLEVARWRGRLQAVTDSRIIVVGGLLRRITLDVGLERVTDVTVRQTSAGRWLGFGDVIVELAGRDPLVLPDFAQPPAFRQAIIDGQEALVSRRADAILAASRAEVIQAGGAAPAAGAANEARGAAGVGGGVRVDLAPEGARPETPEGARPETPEGARPETPEAVTETLARLSKLRDAGTITDDDYEAKKADLLDRL